MWFRQQAHWVFAGLRSDLYKILPVVAPVVPGSNPGRVRGSRFLFFFFFFFLSNFGVLYVHTTGARSKGKGLMISPRKRYTPNKTKRKDQKKMHSVGIEPTLFRTSALS